MIFICGLVFFSTIVREALFCSRWWLIQGLTAGRCAESKRLVYWYALLNGATVLNTLLPMLRDHCRRGHRNAVRTTATKEWFSGATGKVQVWTHNACASRYKMDSSSSQTEPHHGGEGEQSPPPSWGVTLWEWEAVPLKPWLLVG